MTEHSPVAIWAAILLIGVATYLIRLSFIHLFGRIESVPDRAMNALQFVPPAVFAALAVPSFLAPGGAVAVVGNERLLAGIVAGAVAWYVDDVFATIFAGMAALWLLRFGI